MITNWVRHKVQDLQHFIFDMSGDVIDDIPADEIPDNLKSIAESSTDTESSNLRECSGRSGAHSQTH